MFEPWQFQLPGEKEQNFISFSLLGEVLLQFCSEENQHWVPSAFKIWRVLWASPEPRRLGRTVKGLQSWAVQSRERESLV